MAGAKAKDPKAAKEKRQKQVLAVGVVLLGILLFVQLPKLMNRGGSAAPPPPPAAATTAASTAAGAAPSALTAPSVAAAATTTASASGLADTGVPPAPQPGQLVHFDLFPSKDPFVQQVKQIGAGGAAPSPAGGSSTSTASSTSGSPFGSPGGSTTTTTAASGQTTMVAQISMNGVTQQVVAGGDFPSDSPVFHLQSFDASTAEITVVGGQYADGSAALPLHKGRPVTLENTTDGTKYRLVYLGRTEVPTASLPVTSTTTAASTTVPAAGVPTAPTSTAATTTTATTTSSTSTTTTTTPAVG